MNKVVALIGWVVGTIIVGGLVLAFQSLITESVGETGWLLFIIFFVLVDLGSLVVIILEPVEG